MAPRSAQCDSGPHFCALFSTFGALWAPRKRQKELQGAQRRPKWCPKWSRRLPKATSKGYFFEIGKTSNFDDSTMIFMVFSCPLLSRRGLGSSKPLQRSNHGPLAGAGRPGQQDLMAGSPPSVWAEAAQGPGNSQDTSGSSNCLKAQLQCLLIYIYIYILVKIALAPLESFGFLTYPGGLELPRPLLESNRHKKTMKIIVLSSTIKVSLNSKNIVPGTTFGVIWAHLWVPFGRFWPPWASLGRPWAPTGAPKSRHGPKKYAPEPPSPLLRGWPRR